MKKILLNIVMLSCILSFFNLKNWTRQHPSNPSTFSILFIDVNQGDAALVECDGHHMLIDGGDKSNSSKIYTILKDKEITHLDFIIASHAHEDHVGGLAGALNYADADTVLCPTDKYDSEAFSDFKKYANEKGGGIIIPTLNDTYYLGSAKMDILAVNTEESTNNSSIVLMITYGENQFLFTADAEREVEYALLDSKIDLSATVLKVAHHGSDTSTSYPFLKEVMPTYAIISVGKNNNYGHPTEQVLSKLHDAEVEVFRTDLLGDILCTSDGKNVYFEHNDTLSSQSSVDATVQENKALEINYIINIHSNKFHTPYCESVQKMSESNKINYTGTYEELIEQGYKPCAICNSENTKTTVSFSN